MSFDHIIRETQRMQRLLYSVSLATQISESMKLASAIPKIELQAAKTISEQYSTIIKAAQPKIDFASLGPQLDIPRITAALQPSIDFAQIFKQISAPLPIAQIDFLNKVALPKIDVSNITAQLILDAKIIGEFEREAEEDESSEQPETSEITESIHGRFELIRFLPLRVIDAIAENPELMRGLDPRDFEKLVADLLHSLEFENIILTPRSSDGGRDVLATKFVSGIPLLFSFECKRYAGKIGLDLMRGLVGSVAHGATKANMGVLVTTSSFTKGAKDFIISEPLVDGKYFNDLVSWLNNYKSKAG